MTIKEKEKHMLTSILHAPIGSTIAFIYNSGSKPGSIRCVKVLDVTSSYIRGEDKDDGDQIKTFSMGYDSTIEVLSWPEEDIKEPFFKFNEWGDLIIINGCGDELVIIANPTSKQNPVEIEYSPDNSETTCVNPEQLLQYMMAHLGVTK